MNAFTMNAEARFAISVSIAPRRLMSEADEDELLEWLDHWRSQRARPWEGGHLRGAFVSTKPLTVADTLDVALSLTFHSDIARVRCSAPHAAYLKPARWLTVRPGDPVLQQLRHLYRHRVIDAASVVTALNGGLETPKTTHQRSRRTAR